MSTAKLLDELQKKFSIKNDAALARELDLTPVDVSKLRSGKVRLGPRAILSIHEHLGVAVAEIRQLAA
jgi:DNA-binding transcriptional regulator YdaS (Cro superfamily)